MGTISLILHGTRDRPGHMELGATSSEETEETEPSPDDDSEEMYPTGLLEQFEKQLLRMHHRKDGMSGFGF